MKIILEDFNYRGKHIGNCEFDFKFITELEDVPADKMKEYILETLDKYLEEGEG